MRSFSIPAPPKILLVIFGVLALISFAGAYLGGGFSFGEPTGKKTPIHPAPSPRPSPKGGGGELKVVVKARVKNAQEAGKLVAELQKDGYKAGAQAVEEEETKASGYAVAEEMPEELATSIAAALRLNKFSVTIVPLESKRSRVQVGETFGKEAEALQVVESLKKKGYIFRVQPHEKKTKVSRHLVVVGDLTEKMASSLQSRLQGQGFPSSISREGEN